MGYFLNKLAEEIDDLGGRTVGSTAKGALAGLAAGGLVGGAAAGIPAGYGYLKGRELDAMKKGKDFKSYSEGLKGRKKMRGSKKLTAKQEAGLRRSTLRNFGEQNTGNSRLQKALRTATSKKSGFDLAKRIGKIGVPVGLGLGALGGGYLLGDD